MKKAIPFFNNETFYPTPKELIKRMADKIKEDPSKTLDPSAGKGDLIEGINENRHGGHYSYAGSKIRNVSAIEIDKDLRAVLREKGIQVIDTDFLAYSGPDKFDLIIANPPFKDGDKHLLKAIDILYRGQIIFLLNADTIRNPYTNTRKALVRKLEELDAEIEYIQDAFKDAERKTGVEIALVNIIVERQVEEDLFAGCEDEAKESGHTIKEDYDLTTGKHIYEMVAEYNQIINVCTETIVTYYKNWDKVSGYIWLNKDPDRYIPGRSDMTALMQGQINDMLVAVRKNFWRKTLDFPEVKSRMTSKKKDEFEHTIDDRCNMDFTENNIRNFVLNLIDGYEQTLTEAVLSLFDKFTRHGYQNKNPREKNIHYFNGWKTNDAFKVGKKVILPLYGTPFTGWSGEWKLSYDAANQFTDIDIVMNYFDGMNPNYLSMGDAIESAFKIYESRNIESAYFKIHCYKKGTIHLTFLDEDILRRFNVVACKGKKWLPEDYGIKDYERLENGKQSVVDSFEGKKSYQEHLHQPLFARGVNPLQIEEPTPEPVAAQMSIFG